MTPIPPTTSAQIDNVLAGRSAFGGPGFSPIAYPRKREAWNLLFNWTDEYLHLAHGLSDETRTAVIRKLALHLIRRGFPNTDDSDIRNGLSWFRAHPADATTRLGLAGAARCFFMAERHRQNQHDVYHAVRAAMALPEPPCPVVFASGAHTLYELVHPMHLLRAGRSARNCLARRLHGDLLPNPVYWRMVAQGDLHLYALSQGTTLCCVFAVFGDTLREWEFVSAGETPSDVFPRCMEAVAARLGPIQDRLTRIIIDGEPIACPPRQTPIIYQPAAGGRHARI